jgi:hypothetical protein
MIYLLQDHVQNKIKLIYRKLKFDDIIQGKYWEAKYTHDTWVMQTRLGMEGTKYYKFKKYTPHFLLYEISSSKTMLIEGLGELIRYMIKLELIYFYKEYGK